MTYILYILGSIFGIVYLKDWWNKKQISNLEKKDVLLKEEQTDVEKAISDLELGLKELEEKKKKDLTPDEIVDFWKGNK